LGKASVETSKGIQVLSVEVQLDRLYPFFKAGHEYGFTGTVFIDDVPAPEPVHVEIFMDDKVIGSGDTIPELGYFDIRWNPGFDLVCRTYTFKARALGVYSSPQTRAVAAPTRITDFKAPDKVGKGTPFEVSGILEYESAPETWSPLSGATVKILYNTTEIGTVTTDENGKFVKSDCKITTAGTYTLKAVYEGEGLAAALVERALTVIGDLTVSIASTVLGALIVVFAVK